MISINRLQDLVNNFNGLTKKQKQEALICFKGLIETISDEEVKAIFKELLDCLTFDNDLD